MRHGDLTLLSDPWWSGPAYRGQWYPYPLPVPERYDLARVDAVYVSHAHEDHLHAQTLRELLKVAPNAEAIVPLRYDTQMRDYLRRIGFTRIRELTSGVPCVLRRGDSSARLTVMTHMDDSLLAVEAGDEVLLNVNDALHASRRDLIVEYCRILRGRWPTIDYLFCGFGGASYFPNCIRVPGKDDVAVARTRETFFLENFALIAQLLGPKLAVPFAAHFVLPDEDNWWISETRLRMEPPSATVRRLMPNSSTRFVDLQPGDFVEGGNVTTAQQAHTAIDPAVARDAVRARYPIRATARSEPFDDLVKSMRAAISSHATPNDSLDVVVLVRDEPTWAVHVVVQRGIVSVEAVLREVVEQLAPEAIVETRSDLLASTMRSPFGRDLITIGYGAIVTLRSREVMPRAPHDRLLALLSPPEPRWRQRLRQAPLRTAKFVFGDASMRLQMLSRLPRRRQSRPNAAEAEPELYAVTDWA